MTEEKLAQINSLRIQSENDKHLFEKLASNICPEIYGMHEVKQALLLLMVGGNLKYTNLQETDYFWI